MKKIFWLAGHTLWFAGLLCLSGCLKKRQYAVQLAAGIDTGTTSILITPSKLSKEKETSKTSRFTLIKPIQSAQSQISSKSSIEARLNDIPVYLGSKLIEASRDDKGNSRLKYTASGTLEEVYQGYAQDFQGAGWQISHVYEDTKCAVLVGKKPKKCVILHFAFKKAGWFSAEDIAIEIVVGTI